MIVRWGACPKSKGHKKVAVTSATVCTPCCRLASKTGVSAAAPTERFFSPLRLWHPWIHPQHATVNKWRETLARSWNEKGSCNLVAWIFVCSRNINLIWDVNMIKLKTLHRLIHWHTTCWFYTYIGVCVCVSCTTHIYCAKYVNLNSLNQKTFSVFVFSNEYKQDFIQPNPMVTQWFVLFGRTLELSGSAECCISLWLQFLLYGVQLSPAFLTEKYKTLCFKLFWESTAVATLTFYQYF